MTPMLKASPLSPDRAQARSIKAARGQAGSDAAMWPGGSLAGAGAGAAAGETGTGTLSPSTSTYPGTDSRSIRVENTRQTGAADGRAPNQPVVPTDMDVAGLSSSRRNIRI